MSRVYTLGTGRLSVEHSKGEVILRYEAAEPDPGTPAILLLRFRNWQEFMDVTSEMLHQGTLAWPEVKKLYDSV